MEVTPIYFEIKWTKTFPKFPWIRTHLKSNGPLVRLDGLI